jgi:hypothetical protein
MNLEVKISPIYQSRLFGNMFTLVDRNFEPASKILWQHLLSTQSFPLSHSPAADHDLPPTPACGYDRRALAVQTLLTWIVLPVTYLVTDPAANINWVFGFGKESQTVIHPLLYLALGIILLPVVVYLPGHLVLLRLFSHRRNKAAKSHDCVPPK